jgi:hypothetical protein
LRQELTVRGRRQRKTRKIKGTADRPQVPPFPVHLLSLQESIPMGVLVVEAVAVAVEGDCLLLHLPLPLLLVGFPTGTQIVEVAKAVVGPRPPRLPRGIPMGTPEGVVAMAMDQVIHPEVKR